MEGKSEMKKKLTDRWESEWLDKASLFREILLNDKETEFVKLDLRGFKISKLDGSVPYIKGKKLVKRIFLMRIFRDVGLKSADLKSVPFVTLI